MIERYLDRTFFEPNCGCWLWGGARNKKGYGILNLGDVTLSAHRVFYETLVGPIPVGLEIDHKCRIKCCVNPDHLEPVTRKVNQQRAGKFYKRALQTHCLRGHEFTKENTRISSNGTRHCRACGAEHNRRWTRAYRRSTLPKIPFEAI